MEGDLQDPLTFLWVASKRKKTEQGKDYLITAKQYLQYSKEPETSYSCPRSQQCKQHPELGESFDILLREEYPFSVITKNCCSDNQLFAPAVPY